MTSRPRRQLPHGFQEKTTPDGRTYWIDFRPQPPSWLPPADVRADNPMNYLESHSYKSSTESSDIHLPKGVTKHYTPSGSVYYVDSRPRACWVDPRTVDFAIDAEREGYTQNSEVLFTGGEILGKSFNRDFRLFFRLLTVGQEPPPEAHIEYRLLMDLTKWRVGKLRCVSHATRM